MRAALLAILLVGCSIPEKHFDNGVADAPQGTIDTNPNSPDGSSPDASIGPDAGSQFSCMGQPFPTTAPATIKVSGLVAKLDGGTFVSGATVGGYVLGGTTPIITTTTDGSGNYSASVPTGGQAISGFIKSSGAGTVDAYVYPQAPIDKDANISIETFTSPISSSGLDPTMAQLLILVHDCNGTPLAGATIALQPSGGQIQYVVNGQPSQTATATDGEGAAFVFNYPPGSPNLTATASGGIQLRPHQFPATANSVTTADIQP